MFVEQVLIKHLNRFMAAFARLPLIARFEAWLLTLPPYGALATFAGPSVLILPIKVITVWCGLHGYYTLALLTLMTATAVLNHAGREVWPASWLGRAPLRWLITATHHDLRTMVADGRFRADLYYRLNVFTIDMPPLRGRREDVPLLIEHFVARYARDRAERAPRFEPSGVQALMHHAFPGDVRELKNLVERLVIMNPGAAIGAAEVAAVLGTTHAAAQADTPETLAEAVRAFERRTIEAALEAESGVIFDVRNVE